MTGYEGQSQKSRRLPQNFTVGQRETLESFYRRYWEQTGSERTASRLISEHKLQPPKPTPPRSTAGKPRERVLVLQHFSNFAPEGIKPNGLSANTKGKFYFYQQERRKQLVYILTVRTTIRTTEARVGGFPLT